MFARLTSRQPAAFGLDISPSGIKFVQLHRTPRGLQLDCAGNIPYPRRENTAGKLISREELRTYLLSGLKGKSLSPHVVASLPESKTFIEVVNVPKNGPEPFSKRLLDTLPEYLPLPLEESYFDSQIIREDIDRWVALVGSAPKVIVDEYLNILQSAGLTPLALDIEAPTIARAVLRNTAKNSVGATAILDLGQSHASLILMERESIQFTMSLPVAGAEVTTQIATALHLNYEEAETSKRSCSDHPEQCPTELKLIIDELVRNLTTRVREAEAYYVDHFGEASAIARVYLCGGGAHLALLNSTLSTALGVPVTIADPWAGIANAPTDSPLSLTTALGLALRALDAPNAL